MPDFHLLAVAGYAIAVIAALLVTQSKQRVSWPAWLVPVVLVAPFAAWTALAIAEEGLLGFLPAQTGSLWGIQIWLNFLMALMAAFFLLQNRARAAGMKSEVWVLVVIFTGSIGLFVMLARLLYLERRRAG